MPADLMRSDERPDGGRPIKAGRLVGVVLIPTERPIALVEVLMVVLVIFSTATLSTEPSTVQSEDLTVNRIQGTMILSTASSMDALGLAGFKRWATATVDLTVRPAESRACASCNANWSGLNIEGEVTITELFDEVGHPWRIEATINITYLVERSSSDIISREWMLIDWEAGDASSHSEILIVHDPPRWMPTGRIDAAFVSNSGELQSRTGPHITVEDIGAGMLRSSGCLPDSFTCSRVTRPDIDLISSSGQALAPLVIDGPSGWQALQLPADPAASSDRLAGFRSVLDLRDSIERQTSFCPWTDETVLSSSSWTVMDAGPVAFTPLAAHLSSLGLPVASIHLGAGVWTEVDLEDRSCGALIDDDGRIRLGFATL